MTCDIDKFMIKHSNGFVNGDYNINTINNKEIMKEDFLNYDDELESSIESEELETYDDEKTYISEQYEEDYEEDDEEEE